MPSAVIQVFAYREPGMDPVLDEIAALAPPDGWTVDHEAWVTLFPQNTGMPDAYRKANCTTWGAATRADKFEPHEAPMGKLSARNEAHAHAVDAGYDVIVTWDADARPMHDDVLVELLEPFNDPGVVATNSRPHAGQSVMGLVVNAGSWLEDIIRPHLHGQCSAFRTGAWQRIGPFDVGDETQGTQVRREEEIRFRQRLEQLGEVRYVPGAAIFNDPRRHFCKIGMGDDAYCGRLGTETFEYHYDRRR